MSENDFITIKGARVNNLKNIDVRESRRWHSIRCMPKGKDAMWKVCLLTPASFSDV